MADIAEIGFKADTSGLVKAKRDMDALSPSAAKLDRTTDQLTTKTDALGNAAQRAAVGIQKETSATAQAAAGFTQAGSAADVAAGKVARMSAAANQNNAALAASGQQYRLIAQQLSQVAQQTQATGNFMQALAIQLPDIGLAFGAVGTAIGVVAGVAISYFSSIWSGGAKSAETLQNEAKLVQRVAEQWGIALPALKAYADAQGRLVDQQNQIEALLTARNNSTASLAAGFDNATIELVDMQDKLNTLGANNAAQGLRDKFEELRDKVATGKVTLQDFDDVLSAAKATFGNAKINGDNFIGMLAGLKGQASALIPTMAALGAEVDRLFGAAGGSPNGRSIRGGKLGFDPRFPTLPDFAPVPDRAPNREDQGAYEDRLAARAARGHGKTDAQNFEDITKGADRQIATLKAQQVALGLSDEATARLKYETQLLNEAQQKNVNLSPEQRAALMGLAGDMASLEVATAKVKEQLDFSKGLFKGFVNDIASGLRDGQSFWKSFGSAALNVLDKITDKLLNDVIDALFQVKSAASGSGGGSLFGSIANGIGSLLGFGGGSGGFSAWDYASADLGLGLFAKGEAFPNGISAHSNSIVSRPTAFAFASGAGVMGEAGPEGILPLTRMGNGDLGVQMSMADHANSNAPTPVNINVNIDGANGDQHVIDLVRQGVSEGLEQFDNHVLPSRVNEISRDPRGR